MTRLASFAILAAVLAGVPASAAPAEGAWSTTVDGVRARLVVTPFVDASKHAQLAIALELDNASDRGTPITIAAGAPSQMIDLVLEDEHGKAIAQAGVGGNELTPPPFVLALPWRATLRWTIAASAYEYVPSGRTMLRPFSLVAWDVPAKHGTLYLKAKLHPVAAKDVTGAWRGPLDVPRVALP